jgi:MFS family permease
MLGSILGGSVAGRTWRIGGVALTLLVGGLFAAVVFVVAGSPWLTVLLAAVGAVLLTVFEPVTWTLIAELAGESRATANGMLAVSNQLGATIGASVGGLVLIFGVSRSLGCCAWAPRCRSVGHRSKSTGHRCGADTGGRGVKLRQRDPPLSRPLLDSRQPSSTEIL